MYELLQRVVAMLEQQQRDHVKSLQIKYPEGWSTARQDFGR